MKFEVGSWKVAYAPGKVILFGEHAVVYGQPAIAVPVTQVQAKATVETGSEGQGITIIAEDLERSYTLEQAPPDDALRAIVVSTLEHIGVGTKHDLTITVSSTIPIARGLGSGAAVSTAIVRALSQHFDRAQYKHFETLAHPLSSRTISDLVYETEKIHHGTPSGIDNTVIAFEKPVYFVRDRKIEIFSVKSPFLLVIADTGIASPTKIAVSHVRRAWEREREKYEELFDEIGTIAEMGRQAIERGEIETVGRLMDENHRLLQLMGVSSPELEGLVKAARQGGALGAKLSGAGRGGNVIALVTQETRSRVELMLRLAGARDVIITEVS
ncbi:MAG: mevalonate kinase [Anaerolineae bacterium]|nr:mevalonate kinase [Anaerolineae bacterium]